MKHTVIILAAAAATFAVQAEPWTIPTEAPAPVWRNLDDAHRVGGRKVSDGYLRGKVVLVYRWKAGDEAAEEPLARLESVWSSYRTKPFVLLGSVSGAKDPAALKPLLEEKGVSFPVYADAGLVAENEGASDCPFLVCDSLLKRRYLKDERKAEEAVVMKITDFAAPNKPQLWTSLIENELKLMPGQAYLRLLEYNKKNPKDKTYAEQTKALKADTEVQKLAKLVAFASKAKDYNPKSKKNKVKVSKAKVEMALKAGAGLKESKNPLIVQEAKNALADLQWKLLDY